jgi:GT2 family glycosyltransferase
VTDSSNVSVVVVSFKSEKALSTLLPSLPKNVELIIVNNSSDLYLEDIIKPNNYKEIRNTENKGFGSACNIGVKVATKDYIFLLNPDTILHKDCIDNLLSAANELPKASAFAPKIIGKKNREDFKRRSILLEKSLWLKKPPHESSEIPIMGGAAIFVKKENYLKVGGFDENIFLYHEDDDLSLRLKKEFGPLIYYPKASISHQSGSSSTRSPYIAALKGFHMGRSRIYAMRKYNIKNYQIKCISLALIQLFSIEMIYSQRKRSKYLAFFKGVINGLREEKNDFYY